MDEDLLGRVIDRLAASAVDSRTESLVLGAFQGDNALQDAITGASPRPDERRQPGPVPTGTSGAYLRSVTVQGFRGIGPATTLQVEPGAGLTVVCGRNGSGKSSFAEALEVLLTGNLRRFAERSAVWRDGWRSLHDDHPAVSARFAISGRSQPVEVRRDWGVGTKVTEGTATGLSELGWGDALSSYRPFLSHSELESMLGEPKALHDQLSDILGLENLVDASKRLGKLRLEAEKIAKAPKEALPDVRRALQDLGDEPRATQALTALGPAPDLEALKGLATGTGAGSGGALRSLEGLRALQVPAIDQLDKTAAALITAADQVQLMSASEGAVAARTADLLAAAVGHFDLHGPGDCPVCAAPGRLDALWRQASEAQIVQLRAVATAFEEAKVAAEQALGAASSLIQPFPPVLDDPSTGIDIDAAAAAWRLWTTATLEDAFPERCRSFADHLTRTGPPLIAAVKELVRQVDIELAGRQDRWAAVAPQLLAWVQAARRGAVASSTAAALKKAENWLKAANDELRNERLRPFADQAVAIWAQLRSESNVDLAGVRLAGSATQSRVDFEVTVDGAVASALGVMSQGEVNALALAVFLPRAMLGDSPFRFLVIDDPVQAMDPSKVDGLAQVLAGVAAERQVIVFTHDDRLPNAVRRLGLPARIIGVTRRPGSVVELHPAGDPSTQLLRDARQLTTGDGVPVQVARRVIPGLCRSAIESVLIDATRRRQIDRGRRHEEIDEAVEDAKTTTKKAALAIFDDPDRGGDVLRWLSDTIGGWAATTFQTCNKGAHGTDDGFDAVRLVASARDLCDQLQTRLR